MTKTCPYFNHHKTQSAHMHLCTHERNITLRCGYEVDDWFTCPLVKVKDMVDSKTSIPVGYVTKWKDIVKEIKEKRNHDQT